MEDFCVYIPTYNEARTIGPLVRELKTLGARVTVIDDSSPDMTGQIAMRAGAVVHRRPEKSGLASAYIDALAMSTADYTITMDAGGTHTPAKVMELYNMRKEADIVIAQRSFHGLTWRRLLSQACGLFFLRHGIRDATCGLRCYRIDKIRSKLPLIKSKGHVFQAELLALGLLAGLSVACVEIPYLVEKDSRVRVWEMREALCLLPLLLGY